MRQYAAEEKAKEDARLAPIREAETALTRTAGKLLEAERETVLNGKDDQALSLLSEPMRTIKLGSLEEVSEHNTRAANEFMRQHPDYYQSPTNAETITEYATRNGIVIFDAFTLAGIARRLQDLGLLEEPPAVQPEPVIEQEPKRTPIQPQMIVGRDIVTGAPKEWHPSELDRLSADDYRKALDLPTKQVIEYREGGIRW
jgi:hypothetical protein